MGGIRSRSDCNLLPLNCCYFQQILKKFIDAVENVSQAATNNNNATKMKKQVSSSKACENRTSTPEDGKSSSNVKEIRARMQKWLELQPFAVK